MIEFILIFFFAISVATNILYIYLVYRVDNGEALPLIRPPSELLRPWTKNTKGRKPRVNDDDRAYEKETEKL